MRICGENVTATARRTVGDSQYTLYRTQDAKKGIVKVTDTYIKGNNSTYQYPTYARAMAAYNEFTLEPEEDKDEESKS